ncbi:MAG TPA: vitamin K epoxide reductase family protein [Acidobacteriaceae bacterium]|nr:vitamin K epoxide reductase family protein [Acidobacteriaceae bacterium]
MRYLIALLAVAGVVISSMALHVHMMDPSAAPPCAVSEHWDCGAVNQSKYATFPPLTYDDFDANGRPSPKGLHIPVATIGIVGYALIALFAILGRFWIVLELAQIGFFCAAFLSYIEKYILQKWCIYCVWSQVTVTAVLIASIVAVVLQRRKARAIAGEGVPVT